MNIVTVTINPAFDVHCGIENFLPEHENHMLSCIRDAGGKGINVARALAAQGMKSDSFVILGRQNADDFESEINKSGISYFPFYVKGRIRENITIHPQNGKETRISFDDFAPGKEAVVEIFESALKKCFKDTLFVFAGRLPDGIDAEFVIPLLHNIKKSGAKLIVDSSSFTPKDIEKIKPWLIKPNDEEIVAFCKGEVNGVSEADFAAKKIREIGVENVMVSLGSLGAVLSCSDGDFYASVPKIDALSTIGAGDSSIAGFLFAFASGKNFSECLLNAVSCGTAACLTEGTKPPRAEDIARLKSEISVIRL